MANKQFLSKFFWTNDVINYFSDDVVKKNFQLPQINWSIQ